MVGLNRENFIKKNSKSKEKVIFIDIPLLFEKKLERNFDLVVSIISTRKNRVRRVLKNNKFSRMKWTSFVYNFNSRFKSGLSSCCNYFAFSKIILNNF